MFKNELIKNINENLALPFSSFSKKEIFEEEKKEIFYKDWVFICHENQLLNENDYFSLILLEEPIFVKRIKGKLKVFSNVCRHRGTMLLKEGYGNSIKTICPYHAWTYDNEGQLKITPFALKDEINKKEYCLKQFNLEVWQGLVFINLSNDAQSLSLRYKNINKYFDLFYYKEATKAFILEEETWKTNWKLAFENAAESYHLFMVHKTSLETITPTKDAFYLEGNKDFSITAGAMESYDLGINKFLFGEKKEKDFYVLISLPPSFVGILTYESLSWISIYPKKEDECLIRSAGANKYGNAGSNSEQEFTKKFLLEDKELCEFLQKSMKSDTQAGKLLEVEKILMNFHAYYGNRLFNIENNTYNRSEDYYKWFSK